MIDFKNGSFLKLKKTKGDVNAALINPLLVEGEGIISEYQSIRDFVVRKISLLSHILNSRYFL